MIQANNELFIIPAYGANYETAQEMVSAWNAGKDFKIFKGPYCSVRDINLLKKQTNKVLLTNDFHLFVAV